MPYTKIQLVFDATAPEKLGPFRALALGYVMDPIPPGQDGQEPGASGRAGSRDGRAR
jgi:hypothetical protein